MVAFFNLKLLIRSYCCLEPPKYSDNFLWIFSLVDLLSCKPRILTDIKHFEEGVTKGGASALLAASVFHFAEFSIKEVKKFLDDKKIPVRIN